MSNLFKDVKYFNGRLYIELKTDNELNKMLTNKNELKNGLIIHIVTSNKILVGKEKISKYFNNINEYNLTDSVKIVQHIKNTLKYKVYKEIRKGGATQWN